MNKLFVSVPMRGKTDEEIKKSIDKMHKIAEAVFDQKLDLIDSFFEGGLEVPEGCNERMYSLGESIKLISQADYYIGVSVLGDYPGCAIENIVAAKYGAECGLERYYIDANAPFLMLNKEEEYCVRV